MTAPDPRGRRRRCVRLGALGLALVVLTAGCRLELDLNVTVERDGSGSVEVVAALDPDAVARLGGDLAGALALDDLGAAGWEVRGPEVEEDGFTRVRVRKRFADPEQASVAFAEVAGQDGPLRDLGVSRRRSFARTEWGFAGVVDLSGGLEAFSDDDLAAELDGEPLGQSIDDLERRLGATLDRLVGLRVSVRLPGSVTSNAVTPAEDGAVWDLSLGGDPAQLSATGSERRTEVWLWVGSAALALVLLVWLLVRLTVRSPHRRAAGAGPVDASDAPEGAPRA